MISIWVGMAWPWSINVSKLVLGSLPNLKLAVRIIQPVSCGLADCYCHLCYQVRLKPYSPLGTEVYCKKPNSHYLIHVLYYYKTQTNYQQSVYININTYFVSI